MRLIQCVCFLLLAGLAGLCPAQSLSWQSGEWVVGTPAWITSEYEDTFASIGEEHGYGFLELVRANPEVDPWLPGDGTRIRLPARHILPSGPHEGIIINLAEYRLYHFRDGRVVTYPVGIGNTSNPSPLTRTSIRMRLESPAWYPPESIREEARQEGNPLPAVIPPGPANPLGPFALQLEEDGYLIHGTNKRFGVGQKVSHGCIRMFNEHIEELVWEVEKGSSVRIVEEPVKTAVENGTVWLQIHGQRESLTESDRDALWRMAEQATQRVRDSYPGVEIHRKRIEEAVERADGIARRVGMVTGISPG